MSYSAAREILNTYIINIYIMKLILCVKIEAFWFIF